MEKNVPRVKLQPVKVWENQLGKINISNRGLRSNGTVLYAKGVNCLICHNLSDTIKQMLISVYLIDKMR